ncbi:hypothetical protein K431DRAFT_115949 [Polychaeton citri CBS 116435]|uniref:Uncharacterized protein n=1 Tax=Polychaeton citri CBS 116435 TaxID=1314669 RepID=A0A9P4QHG4_9PEZI|nr:hypothetical protein K431DRAFT_115949 [Polychaeton citri CBS 116435]
MNHACGFLTEAEAEHFIAPVNEMCGVFRAVWESAMPAYGSLSFPFQLRPCRSLRSAIARNPPAVNSRWYGGTVSPAGIIPVVDTTYSTSVLSGAAVYSGSAMHLHDSSIPASSSKMGRHSFPSPTHSMRKNHRVCTHHSSGESSVSSNQDQHTSKGAQCSIDTAAEYTLHFETQDVIVRLRPKISYTEAASIPRAFSPTIRRPKVSDLVSKGEVFLRHRTEAGAGKYFTLCDNYVKRNVEGDGEHKSIRGLLPSSVPDADEPDPPESFDSKVRSSINTSVILSRDNILSDLGHGRVPVREGRRPVRDGLAIAADSTQAWKKI